jgi:hypothetical protein
MIYVKIVRSFFAALNGQKVLGRGCRNGFNGWLLCGAFTQKAFENSSRSLVRTKKMEIPKLRKGVSSSRRANRRQVSPIHHSPFTIHNSAPYSSSDPWLLTPDSWLLASDS